MEPSPGHRRLPARRWTPGVFKLGCATVAWGKLLSSLASVYQGGSEGVTSLRGQLGNRLWSSITYCLKWKLRRGVVVRQLIHFDEATL